MKTKTPKRLNTHFNPYPHEHRAVVTDNGREENAFKWHFQRGLLSPRMSGLELCEFILKHMQAIIGQGLLSAHPAIENEFKAMFVMLSTSPKSVIDRLLPWIRVEYHTEEDDIIFMNLFDKRPQAAGPTYFT